MSILRICMHTVYEHVLQLVWNTVDARMLLFFSSCDRRVHLGGNEESRQLLSITGGRLLREKRITDATRILFAPAGLVIFAGKPGDATRRAKPDCAGGRRAELFASSFVLGSVHVRVGASVIGGGVPDV